MTTPLDLARQACDTMLCRYAAADLPPKGHFHYHQGVFLSGMYETYQLCDEEKYFEYIKGWIDSVFGPDGSILDYSHGDLDDIQPGILLFPLLKKTKDPYYKKCLASVVQEVRDIPRNAEGGWWHKVHMKDQMWLDGLYMSGPFCSEYARYAGERALAQEVVRQALMMERKTIDPETGLLYHAWDGAKEAPWADPVTGRASEFWGRAMGWVPVALLNDLDFLPEDIENRDEIIRMATQLLDNLCRYQSEEGRWYQVVNKGDQKGNWLENSCSCLYVAGLCKSIRKGYMDKKYWDNARRGYEGVIASLEWRGEDIQIGHVCIGTGVGDYQHYCDRPVSVNDLHGVGAFLIMCTEVQRLIDSGLTN